jgi:hypothetical protein
MHAQRSGATGIALRMRAASLVVAAVLAALAAAGCFYQTPARMWADTALPDGQFSLQKQQWAYDGETVTFELQCDPGAVHYVVFGVAGHEFVVDEGRVLGRYRWTRVFRAGPEPQTFEVYARPFLMRGKCDWVRDPGSEEWHFYPGGTERTDLPTAPECVMKVTCYRREVRLALEAKGGPPRRVELAMVTTDGRRVVVPPRPADKPEARGYLLVGPDDRGRAEVYYAPDYGDVSRAGKTRVELVVEHADGTLERITEDLDTP